MESQARLIVLKNLQCHRLVKATLTGVALLHRQTRMKPSTLLRRHLTHDKLSLKLPSGARDDPEDKLHENKQLTMHCTSPRSMLYHANARRLGQAVQTRRQCPLDIGMWREKLDRKSCSVFESPRSAFGSGAMSCQVLD